MTLAKNTYTIRQFSTGQMHYIELSASTVKSLTADGNKRVLCILNNQLHLHAAILKTKEGMYYLAIGAKHLRSLGLKANQKVTAHITVDTTELQFNIPEEFAEVIATDEKAQKIFNGLTDGNKRGLIALVHMVKSGNKRIERSLLIAEKLKAGITSPQKVMKKIP